MLYALIKLKSNDLQNISKFTSNSKLLKKCKQAVSNLKWSLNFQKLKKSLFFKYNEDENFCNFLRR